jgi:exodeoxyribonuclease III
VKILSWNVNGLRACDGKGFRRWLDRSGATVVGLQEVRARHEDLPRRLTAPRGWHVHLVSAERPGYSGVALYSRRPADAVETSLGQRRFDREGRVQIARFGRLAVANVYFPNGNGKARDLSRIPYKLSFYRAVERRLAALRAEGLRVVVMGDFNTAHREIDLARPRQNKDNSGFRPEERAELDRWAKRGWIDSFRCFEPGGGHYTWWMQAYGLRERNVGWRIDYALVCPATRPFLRAAFVQQRVRGSDHCPIGVELDPAVAG